MGNEVELAKHLSELAGRVWVPRAIEDALAVPWVPVLLLGVLGAVLHLDDMPTTLIMG